MKWALVSLLVAAVAQAQPVEPAEPAEPAEAGNLEAAVEGETAPAVVEGELESEEVEAAPPAEEVAAEPVADVAEEVEAEGPVFDEPAIVEAPAAEAVVTSAPWSIGTAHTLPARRFEVGVFQPLRYGIDDTLEVSTHPLLDVVAPNLALKRAWVRIGEWQLASRHSLLYPTGLLQLLSREGVGGILPEETRVPHIIQFGNEVLLSRTPFVAHVLTAKAGVTVAATFGQSTLQSIDLPVVYPRLAAVFSPVSFVLGADLDGELPGPFAYTVDVDVFLVTDATAPFAIEHSGLATWRATSEFVVQAGYKLVFGSYPAGPDGFRTQWHILPLVDLQWAF